MCLGNSTRSSFGLPMAGRPCTGQFNLRPDGRLQTQQTQKWTRIPSKSKSLSILLYEGVLKCGQPQIIHFHGIVHVKPSIWWYPHDYGTPHMLIHSKFPASPALPSSSVTEPPPDVVVLGRHRLRQAAQGDDLPKLLWPWICV